MKNLKAAALAAAIAAVTAPGASAAVNPAYAEFAGCPDRPEVTQCQVATISGGEFKLGSKTVPITSPIKLVGGVTNESVTRIVYEAPGGLKAPAIKVPGGLTGLTGVSATILNIITFGSNDVYATPTLVGDPIVRDYGLDLPLRIKLKNNVLSPNCGIGTASSPVLLKLSTGTTSPPAGYQPLVGNPGTQEFDFERFVGIISGMRYVDNTFSVPKANGCGSFLGLNFLPLIDTLVNQTIGLPSSPGVSRAIQDPVETKVAFDVSRVFAP